MAAVRDTPCTGSRFLVAIGEGDGRDADAGFAEVIFPPFEHRREREPSPDDAGPRLILRRGVTGRLDLYEWWGATRRGGAPQTRTVTVQLLAGDGRHVVLTWRFLGAYPVSLGYSPLNAMDGSVVMEQVALAFARVEMS